jgi:hypothetical protein
MSLLFATSHHPDCEQADEIYYELLCEQCKKPASPSTSEAGAILAALRDGYAIQTSAQYVWVSLESIRQPAVRCLCERCLPDFA